jgi:hypothetical protein
MTESRTSGAKIYALLIGIDHYQPARSYANLQGCVRDINLVADYLQKTLNLPADRLWKLTSPNPNGSGVSAATPQNLLPTYENIINAFKQVTATAKPGEQVYIHYSGHGGRAATVYPEIKGVRQYDEGLVPMDVDAVAPGGRYLRDIELATLLKRMTDKGLVVTVILDSCHSGGATRGDSQVRGGEPDLQTRSKDSAVAQREELIQNWLALTNGAQAGNGSSNWVPSSNNYVLLAACRPTEYAYEYAVNGKERHGALTYWMIDTLKSHLSGNLTYKSLHDRVNAKIQSKFPSQLPMLMGEGERSVFGSDRLSIQYAVTVADVDANQTQVKLNAGLAQGLTSGTRFAIYPLNSSNFTDKQKQLAIIEISTVEASSAVAKVLSKTEGGLGVKGKIEQGAPAVILSAPTDLVRRVRFFDQKQLGTKENELPTPELVNQQQQALETVRQALTGNGWVVEVKPNQEAHYQVAVGRNGEYEICVGMPLKNLNPPLKIGTPGAASEVVKRLVHLAKYQSVQELDNPSSELSHYLKFVLLDQAKRPLPDQSHIVLNQGEVVNLQIQNTFNQPLNVAVLDLEPTWEISQIAIQGLDGPFFQLVPGQVIEIRLRFKVPDGQGYTQAKEMLKLFATRGPADFRWLKLPSLDQPIEKKEFRTTRSLSSAFGKLLEAVGEDVDGAPSLTRAAVYEPDPNADWATKQIVITVKQ